MAFNFESVAHFLSSVVHDVVVGAKAVEGFLVKETPTIEADINTAAAIASAIDPGVAPIAATVSRAAEMALGLILDAVSKLATAASTAETAVAAKGLDLSLDSATVAEFQALYASLEPAIKAALSKV